MRQWYQCEKCKKYYEDETKASACENKHIEEERRKEEEKKIEEEKRKELSGMLAEYSKKKAELDALANEIGKRGGGEWLFRFLWL